MTPRTNGELERLLAQAVDRSVPDLGPTLAATPVIPLETADGIVPTQPHAVPHPVRRTLAGLCACLVLVLCLGIFSFLRTESVVELDVNPSVELTINRYSRVLSARALNEDGVAVLGEMNLRFLDLDTAVNALVGSMALQGYFESGQDVAVLVSVSGGSEGRNLALQQQLAGGIAQAVSGLGAHAEVYTQRTESHNPPAQVTESPIPAPSPTQSPVPSPTPSPASTPLVPPPVDTPTPSAAPTATPAPTPSPTPRPATAAERAVQNGISYGKQVFIDNLLTLDPTLNEVELAAMPIGKISSLVRQRGLDLSLIVSYDPDDSPKENIEDFIDDLDDDDDDDDDKSKNNSGSKPQTPPGQENSPDHSRDYDDWDDDDDDHDDD